MKLTNKDLGCEFMTQEGFRVEIKKVDGDTFLGSDGIWRYDDGKVYPVTLSNKDIVAPIEETPH